MAKQKVFPHHLGSRDATGVMRARDVKVMLAGKVDPAVSAVIEQLAEINHGNVLHLASMASMLDKMTDIIQSFTEVAANMKDRTDQMARSMADEVEGAPTDGPTEH